MISKARSGHTIFLFFLKQRYICVKFGRVFLDGAGKLGNFAIAGYFIDLIAFFVLGNCFIVF